LLLEVVGQSRETPHRQAYDEVSALKLGLCHRFAALGTVRGKSAGEILDLARGDSSDQNGI
jgi:hypothetical protein